MLLIYELLYLYDDNVCVMQHNNILYIDMVLNIISKLAEMLGTSHANLSKKIKIASLNYIDLNQIADLLGYDIEWIKRQ